MPKKPYKLDRVAIRMVKEPPLCSEKPMNCAEAAIELMRDVLREYDSIKVHSKSCGATCPRGMVVVK